MSDEEAATPLALGPFEPPKEYAFEPELARPVPRAIPPELRQGRHGRRQYLAIRGLLIGGFACLASAKLPLVQALALYLLPLGYLNWIGLACLAGGLVVYARDSMEGGPYRYVKHGRPLIARVCQLVVQPSVYYNGQPTGWKFVAELDYRDPATGLMMSLVASSTDLGSGPDRHTTSFRVGDYVTGLAIDAKKPEDAIAVYGFLDLKPGLGVVPRAPTGEPLGAATVVAIVLGIASVLGSIGYALLHLPLEIPPERFWYGLLAVMLAAAWPLGVAVARSAERELGRVQRRNEEALARGEALLHDERLYPKTRGRLWFETVLWMCALFAGLVIAALDLNALLDGAPRQLEPVLIERMIHTTWNGIFREYSIKYKRVDRQPGRPVGSQQSIMSTPEHMARFGSPWGMIQVGRGAFGWPWAESIDPFPVKGGPGR